LAGANTYAGGTTVSAGTLTGTSSSLQGDITNSTTVVFDQATTGTYAGNLSGSGALAKVGSGTVILAGVNTYSGPTTITAGTLSIAGDSSLGILPGSFTPGHLTLNGGTLATTADFTLPSNRGLTFGTSGGTLEVASGTTLSFDQQIVSDFTKAGAGTLRLTTFAPLGQNKNVEIAAGTLLLDYSIPNSTFTIFNGTLSGAGNFALNLGTGSSVRQGNCCKKAINQSYESHLYVTQL